MQERRLNLGICNPTVIINIFRKSAPYSTYRLTTSSVAQGTARELSVQRYIHYPKQEGRPLDDHLAFWAVHMRNAEIIYLLQLMILASP